MGACVCVCVCVCYIDFNYTSTTYNLLTTQVVSFTPLPTDVEAHEGALTFNATGLPQGLSIDPKSGVISGTVSSDAYMESPYSVVVYLGRNDTGATTNASLTLHVIDSSMFKSCYSSVLFRSSDSDCYRGW